MLFRSRRSSVAYPTSPRRNNEQHTIVSTEKLRLDLDIDTASARRASGTRLMLWHRGHTIWRSSLMTCVRDTNDIKNATGYSGDQRAHRQRACGMGSRTGLVPGLPRRPAPNPHPNLPVSGEHVTGQSAEADRSSPQPPPCSPRNPSAAGRLGGHR